MSDCPGCDNRACRYSGCQGRSLRPLAVRAAVDLPRPTVDVVNTEDGKTHVVISRDNKAKSYEVNGIGTNDKVKDAVEKVIGDRHTGEWLP